MHVWHAGALGVVAAVLVAALQGSRIMVIEDVNPNLMLIAGLLGTYLTGRFMWGFGAAAGMIGATLLWYPAFLESAVIGAAVALCASFAVWWFRGRAAAVVAALGGGTALFWLLKAAFQRVPIAPGVLGGEIIYNCLLGACVIMIVGQHARRITS